MMILKLEFDQALCKNLRYELNPRVRCAFGNVLDRSSLSCRLRVGGQDSLGGRSWDKLETLKPVTLQQVTQGPHVFPYPGQSHNLL